MKHRTTLKDIAQETDVSVTSVSLVLNGRRTRITDEKRQLIIDTAKRLHYVPNQTARSLVTNHSMLLALLVPDIENMFFASFAKALEDISRGKGYSLIVANSDDLQNNELTLLHQFEARGVDGLYLIPSAQSVERPDKLQQTVETLTFPTVIADRNVGNQWCDSVRSDNLTGGKLAAQTLIANGHTRIACICQNSGPTPDSARTNASGENTDDNSKTKDSGTGKILRHIGTTSPANNSELGPMHNSDARKAGFLSGLAEAGLSLDPALDCPGNYRFSGGYRAADRIIDGGATAVFCANDLMALGFMQRMKERGLDCPADCSIIGYDNVVSRYGLGVQLTTLDQNIGALAKGCHTMMMNRLHDDIGNQSWLANPQERLIKPKLVRLGTVGPASR